MDIEKKVRKINSITGILAILLLANLVTAEFGVGLSPDHKELKIKAGEQRVTAFMISNGGDSIEITLSASPDFIRPEVKKITIEPKKDKAVNFIISPLASGEYSASVKATATSPSKTGMGLSQSVGASLKILVSEDFPPANPKVTSVSREIQCGDGICQAPFEAHSTCPGDCQQEKEGFNPLKYLIDLINLIKKLL